MLPILLAIHTKDKKSYENESQGNFLKKISLKSSKSRAAALQPVILQQCCKIDKSFERGWEIFYKRSLKIAIFEYNRLLNVECAFSIANFCRRFISSKTERLVQNQQDLFCCFFLFQWRESH